MLSSCSVIFFDTSCYKYKFQKQAQGMFIFVCFEMQNALLIVKLHGQLLIINCKQLSLSPWMHESRQIERRSHVLVEDGAEPKVGHPRCAMRSNLSRNIRGRFVLDWCTNSTNRAPIERMNVWN